MSDPFLTFRRSRTAVVQLFRGEVLRQVARGVAIGLGVIVAVLLFDRGYKAIVIARGQHVWWLFTLQPFLVSASVAAWLPFMFPRRVGVQPLLALLALAVPYATWYVFGLMEPSRQSLANAVVEPFLLGGVASILYTIVFSVPGRDLWQRRLRLSAALGIACLVGLGMALWFPTLPE